MLLGQRPGNNGSFRRTVESQPDLADSEAGAVPVRVLVGGCLDLDLG
jgi:hypothetical protein